MSGGSMTCGTFRGEDKSGSALEGLLKSLSANSAQLVQSILEQLDHNEYVLIPEQQASELLQFVKARREDLVAEIGHSDWRREVEAEEKAGLDSVEAKWGASRGWRLYCADNLINACKASVLQHEPICVAFS